MKKIVYRESDGAIIDALELDANVSGLADGLKLGEGEYSGTETNISELADFVAETAYIPVRLVFERLTAAGKAETVWAALTIPQQLNFLTLKEGIDVDDSTVRALLASLEIDPDTILY